MIMISCTFLRLFELCIRDEIERKIKINYRQFGFKKGSSCALITSVLQEIIEFYNSKGSDGIVAFLDLTKAYDKVNNKILITKMIESKIHPKIITIFRFMCENSYAHVSYNVKNLK